MVPQTFFRRSSSSIAFSVFTLEDNMANAHRAETLTDLNGRAVAPCLHTRQALRIRLIYTLVP